MESKASDLPAVGSGLLVPWPQVHLVYRLAAFAATPPGFRRRLTHGYPPGPDCAPRSRNTLAACSTAAFTVSSTLQLPGGLFDDPVGVAEIQEDQIPETLPGQHLRQIPQDVPQGLLLQETQPRNPRCSGAEEKGNTGSR